MADKPVQIYVVGTRAQAKEIQRLLAKENIAVSVSYGQGRSDGGLPHPEIRVGGSARQVNVSFAPGFILQVADRETLSLLSQVIRDNKRQVWISAAIGGEPTWRSLQAFLDSDPLTRG
jgi:hypothetical protein